MRDRGEIGDLRLKIADLQVGRTKEDRVRRLGLFGLLLLAFASLAACRPRANVPTSATSVPRPPSVSNVPAEFRALYDELNAALTTFDASLDAQSDYPVTFAAELLNANGNRGTDLLTATNLQGTRLWLDRLYALGARGVTLSITYPILTSDFPNAAQYLEYYKTVAKEVRQRGMKLCVEMGVVFPPPFSTLNINYRAITFEQFKATNKQMVAMVIRELQPDYLDLGAEPDTLARITGWRELNTPQGYTAFINDTLNDLPRGNTPIGAGIGTWGNLDFVKSYVTNPALDFVAMHIYPVTGNALQNAVKIADLAHQYGKRVIVDEAWLYKMSAREPPASIAGNAEIFRRDAYSFWAPLDQKFLALVAKLARAKQIEYVSVFWAQYLYAYVDYDAALSKLSYTDLMTRVNRVAAQNLVADKPSATGEFYKRLNTGAR